MRNLCFGVGLAPYRIDFYNYLYIHFDCDIYFRNRKMMSQNYDMKLLHDLSVYTPQYIRTGSVWKKRYAKGLRALFNAYNPEYVLVDEFSLLAVQVLLIKAIFGYKFKVISVCDDSYDMVSGNDFSRMHKIARRLIPPFLNNLLLVDKRVVGWYRKAFGKGVWFPIISDEQRIRTTYKALLPLSNYLNKMYGLEGKKVILFVGRLVALKNVATLIRAYSFLKNKAKLVIIGEGECKNGLKKLADELHTEILFLGRKEGNELLAWYNIADVFVLPSIQEAFGAVTNEALLAGCYAIVSEKAGSSSIVSDKNGAIFSPYDVEGLTSLLSNYIEKGNKSKQIYLKENLMPVSFEPCLNAALEQIGYVNKTEQ